MQGKNSLPENIDLTARHTPDSDLSPCMGKELPGGIRRAFLIAESAKRYPQITAKPSSWRFNAI
jgi:hypothetical protein